LILFANVNTLKISKSQSREAGLQEHGILLVSSTCPQDNSDGFLQKDQLDILEYFDANPGSRGSFKILLSLLFSFAKEPPLEWIFNFSVP
jgi:hypothetical protein